MIKQQQQMVNFRTECQMSAQKWLISIFLYLLVSNSIVLANNDNLTKGAASAAMGSTGLLQQDVFALFNNQAGLAHLNTPAVALHVENRFFLEALSSYTLAAAMPTKSGNFGIGLNYYGNPAYNESVFSLAYGRQLSEQFAIGTTIDVRNISVEGYGSQSLLTFGVGGQYTLNERLQLGAHVYNPIGLQASEGSSQADIPTIMRLGMAYYPAKNKTTSIILEAEKNMVEKPMVKVGFSHLIAEKLAVRAGIATNPALFSFGVGYQAQQFQLDLAMNYHQVLGYSPHFSLAYQLGAKK